MSETTHLKLPFIAAAQAQKHVTHNEALLALDALVQISVIDRDLAAAPPAPAEGDRYVVAAGGLGSWVGWDGSIAAFQDGIWRRYVPVTGWLAWIADEAVALRFDGAGWVDAALSNVPLLGVNADADTINRLSVGSDAVLFSHAGGGMQVKVNKAGVGDTASHLFQTGFSGRAEFGLTGDDDFHLKVSPDGAAWSEAITVKSNGRVGFGTTAPVAPLELKINGGAVDASLLFGNEDLQISKEGDPAFNGLAVGNNAGFRMIFKGVRARDTFAAPAAVIANDQTFSLLGAGYDGATPRFTAGITFAVDGAVSSGNVPQRIILETGTGAGRVERARVTSAGDVGIGLTAPVCKLDVNGPARVKSYTVAGVPSASAGAGQIIHVSNEAGGAVLAFSDGANWRRVTDRAVIS